jgi:hypothetical protein
MHAKIAKEESAQIAQSRSSVWDGFAHVVGNALGISMQSRE